MICNHRITGSPDRRITGSPDLPLTGLLLIFLLEARASEAARVCSVRDLAFASVTPTPSRLRQARRTTWRGGSPRSLRTTTPSRRWARRRPAHGASGCSASDERTQREDAESETAPRRRERTDRRKMWVNRAEDARNVMSWNASDAICNM